MRRGGALAAGRRRKRGEEGSLGGEHVADQKRAWRHDTICTERKSPDRTPTPRYRRRNRCTPNPVSWIKMHACKMAGWSNHPSLHRPSAMRPYGDFAFLSELPSLSSPGHRLKLRHFDFHFHVLGKKGKKQTNSNSMHLLPRPNPLHCHLTASSPPRARSRGAPARGSSRRRPCPAAGS